MPNILDVHDVHAIFSELQPRFEAFPGAEWTGPVNEAYGQRELMILAPDGDVVVFGQAVKP